MKLKQKAKQNLRRKRRLPHADMRSWASRNRLTRGLRRQWPRKRKARMTAWLARSS